MTRIAKVTGEHWSCQPNVCWLIGEMVNEAEEQTIQQMINAWFGFTSSGRLRAHAQIYQFFEKGPGCFDGVKRGESLRGV